MNKHLNIFILILTAFLFSSCISEDEPAGEGLTVGDCCPDFTVTLNDGSTLSTSYLKGKTSMIVFFNTGCPDCRKELPVVQKVNDAVSRENLPANIYCISREEGEQSIRSFWEDNNLSIPYSAQENRKVYNLFAPSVIPRIYIISPSLEITAAWSDNLLPSEEEMLAALKMACK